MWQNDLEFTYPFVFMKKLEERYAQQNLSLIHEALLLVKTDSKTPAIIKVVHLLADEKVDAVVLISYLLAPLLWNKSLSFLAIRKRFGSTIAGFLDNLHLPPINKDGALQLLSGLPKYSRETTILSLAFLFFELEKIIESDTYAPPDIEKARDTVLFFVPVANKLNLWKLQRCLEDAAFHILDPTTYHTVVEEATATLAEDARWLKLVKLATNQLLRDGDSIEITPSVNLLDENIEDG